MRTNVVVDDRLMNDALRLSGLRTKKSAIEAGLKLLVQVHRQRRIKGARGKLRWSGDLDRTRADQ